jgi:enamine deaminase RidA (YjgF/YER057c/UK114 family)
VAQVGAAGKRVTEPTKAIRTKIGGSLAMVSSRKVQMLQATIWHSDMAERNAVWDTWIGPQNPATWACSESTLATSDYKVEIVIVAAK